MEGWGWQSVHDPVILPTVLEGWRGSIATGESFDMVIPLRGADQGFRPFLTRVMPVRDQEGKVARWFGTNTDITEQRAQQELLRLVSEQRELALAAAKMGAWDHHFKAGTVFWDERCRNMFGVPLGSTIDRDMMMARIHPDDRNATGEALKEAIAGADGGAYHREYRVVWPDSSIHWVAAHGQVIFEGQGDQRRAVRIVGVTSEITERRLAESRLRQTQKLETIGVLAGGVAHDFNNLLTVIMGSASSSLAECPSCEYSQAILVASERAAYLTKQLLAYAGKGHTVVKIVDLTDLVSRSTVLLSASVPKRVKLSFNLSKDLPCLEADPSQIEQILMNLVINAAESITPKRDGAIEIATRFCDVTAEMARKHAQMEENAAGAYVCLEVRDDGGGINEATISRIFDPFFSTKFTGRGMGLAAVHGIVRINNGFIDVHSVVGGGTTFQVFLPASKKERPTESVAATPRRQIRGFSTILVVDDEPMLRKLACMTLGRLGYEVLEAGDGREALQLLADSPTLPSLVLLDLAMPVMGGDELVPILEKKYPGLKIIVSSGYSEEDTRQGFRPGSVHGILLKPYTAPKLAATIADALGGNPAKDKIIEFPKTG
jgi:signal transduction histidine kinase/CheY-like chemotaxis protein